jgi:hypothetical protein
VEEIRSKAFKGLVAGTHILFPPQLSGVGAVSEPIQVGVMQLAEFLQVMVAGTAEQPLKGAAAEQADTLVTVATAS